MSLAVVSALPRVASWAACAAALALPLAALAAPAAELVSHQAVYRMTLAAIEPGSGVAGAEGVLLFRFADHCDGWTSEISTDLVIDYGEDGEVRSRWNFASWESKDGLSFRFRSRETESGDDAPALIEGTAKLTALGGGGHATYAKPETMTVSLPAGTQFPTRHLAALLAAARHGETFLSVPLFDGSSTDNPYTVSAVIAPLDAERRRQAAAATGLADMPAWRFTLAFFAAETIDGAPDFGLTVQYRADGTADRLTQDYGDFSMAMSLQQFDPLPAPSCGR